MQSLAAGLSGLPDDRTRRQQLLTHYHDVYPGFITIFAADRQGIVRQIFPPRDSEPPPISDREYFINAVQTRQLAVSEVILGRLSYVPIVTIAVPILDDAGQVAGVAGGSLDLSKFERFVEAFRSLPNALITVLDQRSRVIFTSGKTTFTTLESLANDDLVLERPLAPSLGLANVKDFSLTWTVPDLKDVMASAELVAMNYNPAYMREVFERD